MNFSCFLSKDRLEIESIFVCFVSKAAKKNSFKKKFIPCDFDFALDESIEISKISVTISRDFIFKTLDGEIQSHKSLLYISSPYFRDLFNSDDITLNQITLNYNREAVLQVSCFSIIKFVEKSNLNFTEAANCAGS